MSGLITTKRYTVQDFDTLEGIAARNDSTIGQLMKLNRMPNRTIFSGQTLLVPVIVEGTDDEFEDVKGSPKASSPVVPKSKQFPGHLEIKGFNRECSPVPFAHESGSSKRQSVSSEESDDVEGWKRFLKIHVREFTETEGFVSGVLLVTPNCIMFDPDVTHPLVKENGSERYGMVAPMDAIVSIVLFKNASAITEERHAPDEVYRPPNVAPEHDDGARTPFERKPLAETGKNFNVSKSEPSTLDSKGANSPSPGRKLSEPTLQIDKSRKDPTTSEKCSTETHPSILTDSNRPKVFKTLSHGMSYINRAGGSILHRAQSVSGSSAAKAARMVTNMPRKLVHMSTGWLGGLPVGEEDSHVRHSEPSIYDLQRNDPKTYATLLHLVRKTTEVRENLNNAELTYGSDKTKKSSALFPTVDEMFPYERPGGAYTQLPFFLHIMLNERIMREKADSLGELCRSSKSEFWFSMPKEMADPFYAFLVRCCPEKYGHELDTAGGEVCLNVEKHGHPAGSGPTVSDSAFIVLDKGDVQKFKRKMPDSKTSSFLNSNCTLNEEWEIVSVSEIKRRLSLRDVADVAYHPLPPGCEESTILDETMIRQLIDVLPARAQGYPWVLVYSSELHGFALSTMYRMMSSLKECLSPSLLVVRDTSDHTFGGIVSCLFHVSEHFYGSGESLLFTDYPRFRVFRWTGQNEYIVKGSLESLAIGSGKGLNGLWLDSDFYRGRTESCDTFGNDPLTEPSEFLIAAVEAWCFRLD